MLLRFLSTCKNTPHRLQAFLLVGLVCLSPMLNSWASQPTVNQQLPHLPPNIQPNGFLTPPSTSEDDTALEAVELVDAPSLIAKQAAKAGLSKPPTLNTELTKTSTASTVSIKEIQATAFSTLKPTEKLTVLEQQVQVKQLLYLMK